MDSATLLSEWMQLIAKENKNMHEEASNFYKAWSDSCMLTSIILGSFSGGLNVILGAVDPLAFMFAQIGLGVVVLTSTGILTASKQLKLDECVIKHQEYSSRFKYLHRTIQAELVLL